METKVEALEDNQKKLTVTVDAAEIDERIKKTYKDFAYKYNFPGFRKGKAPRPVIDNALGAEAVRATVTDDLMNQTFPVAMDENDLIAFGNPQIDQDVDMVEAGKPFTYTAVVACCPEFELDSYEPVKIKLPSTEATEEEVDEQIEELRKYYYEFKDCDVRKKLAAGLFADVTVSAKDAEGAAIDSLAADSRLYEMGSDLFPKAFDDALMGMKKGEEKTFEVDMAEPSIMTQGMEDTGVVTFDVKINQVKERNLPEINDEWAKERAGFENVAELRERMAESIKQTKEGMEGRLRESEILYALQKRLKGEAPEVMCENEEQNLMQNFFMQIQQTGMPFDAYLAEMGLTADQFKDDLKKQARDVSEQDLALDAWARNAKITVTDEDVTAEFEKSGAEDPAALEKQWREQGRIASLRQGIKRTRALDAIVEAVEVEYLAPGEKLHADEEAEAEKKPAAKKSAAKKPAAKKPAAKKTAAKKAEGDAAEEKPAKKTTAKKSTKKAEEADADCKKDE